MCVILYILDPCLVFRLGKAGSCIPIHLRFYFVVSTLVLLTWLCPAFTNSVDPDQLASEEAN